MNGASGDAAPSTASAATSSSAITAGNSHQAFCSHMKPSKAPRTPTRSLISLLSSRYPDGIGVEHALPSGIGIVQSLRLGVYEKGAEREQVHVGMREAAEGVGRRADDRLATDVER